MYISISRANYQVGKAWQIRENFKGLFSSDITSAFILYKRWVVDTMNKKIKEVNKIVDMFNNHMRGVVNALINTLCNAKAERLNGKI